MQVRPGGGGNGSATRCLFWPRGTGHEDVGSNGRWLPRHRFGWVDVRNGWMIQQISGHVCAMAPIDPPLGLPVGTFVVVFSVV